MKVVSAVAMRLAAVALVAALQAFSDPSPDAPLNPRLIRLPFAFPTGMENTPIVFNERLLLVDNHRPGGFEAKGEDAYLFVRDLVTGNEVTRFGQGHSFVSAFVENAELHVFATEFAHFGNIIDMKSINHFSTADLKEWKQTTALVPDGNEQFFNTSVCRDDQGYLMAYESNTPVQWCFRFARSKDLVHWERIPGLEFADVEGRTPCANPTIRYCAPYYYVIYGMHCYLPGLGERYAYRLPETKYVTVVARSKDLALWEISPTREAMLDPVPGEGINNTDADLFEYDGNTYVTYATGDQATWGTIRMAMYAGPMKEMFEKYFPAGAARTLFDATQKKYVFP